jgi:hypothetical protein
MSMTASGMVHQYRRIYMDCFPPWNQAIGVVWRGTTELRVFRLLLVNLWESSDGVER